jgi:hypothetical protein
MSHTETKTGGFLFYVPPGLRPFSGCSGNFSILVGRLAVGRSHKQGNISSEYQNQVKSSLLILAVPHLRAITIALLYPLGIIEPQRSFLVLGGLILAIYGVSVAFLSNCVRYVISPIIYSMS